MRAHRNDDIVPVSRGEQLRHALYVVRHIAESQPLWAVRPRGEYPHSEGEFRGFGYFGPGGIPQ